MVLTQYRKKIYFLIHSYDIRYDYIDNNIAYFLINFGKIKLNYMETLSYNAKDFLTNQITIYNELLYKPGMAIHFNFTNGNFYIKFNIGLNKINYVNKQKKNRIF